MVSVTSEVARLRRVVLQRPGAALEAMLPEHIEPGSAQYLLFDDLVHVPQARREHDQLARVLETTAELRYFDELLTETLEDEGARRWLIDEVARLERLGSAERLRLDAMEPERLRHTLVTGEGSSMLPLPNLLFTRDLMAVAGPLLIVGNASKRARRRESLLAWSIARHHPWFAAATIAERSRRVREKGGSFPLTVEGGDVLVLDPTLAVIGASERTTWSMIINLGTELFRHGFSRVLVVEMPKQRSSMHLDTVFTLVDQAACVVYNPILEAGGPEECNVIRLRKTREGLVAEDLQGDLLDILALEGHSLEAIPCGGGDPVLERREQWTDGANWVALAPGIVVGYERNTATCEAMEAAGFRVVDTDRYLADFVRDFQGDFDALVASGRRYAIQITGSELSRGRGGPRCLTLPVHRE